MTLPIILIAAGLAGFALYLAGGRPRVVRARLDIDATPERVFRCLTEPELLMRWIAGLVETTPLTTDGVRTGARSRDVIVEGGRRIVFDSEITRMDRPGVLDVLLTMRGVSVACEYRITPRGTGAALAVEERIQLGGAMRLLAPIATRQMDRQLVAALDRLRGLAAEAPAA
jgi:uncharacterized protein YndB with AHSA1/START domain